MNGIACAHVILLMKKEETIQLALLVYELSVNYLFA